MAEESSSSMHENDLMMNTIVMLDEERQTILSEVLKCAVCLELPKKNQVLICEKGHHFCSTCHMKLKMCGICRGKLLETRNFVVEELVVKLGPILGIPKSELPAPKSPAKYTSGTYQCQHQCQASTPAYLMLPHLRDKHSTHLVDNMRSNPYSGDFSWTYNITFSPNEEYILSAQISDLGLFTVIATFRGLDFFGYVKMLGDKSVSSLFKYQLSVKISPKDTSRPLFQFSVSDCPVASYHDNLEAINTRGNLLKVKGEDLSQFVSVGSMVTVFFSVWKKDGRKKTYAHSIAIAPEKPLAFRNDRKIRRNRNRNMRRKRLSEKFKNLSLMENKLEQSFSQLNIEF